MPRKKTPKKVIDPKRYVPPPPVEKVRPMNLYGNLPPWQPEHLKVTSPEDLPDRPLLFVDVDGVVNPFMMGFHERVKDSYALYLLHNGWVSLSPVVGERLLRLQEEEDLLLVWATTWEEAANADVTPRMKMPYLHYLVFPENPQEGEEDPHLNYKTPFLREVAGDRPFAWLDDEFYEGADEAYMRRTGAQDYLLRRVSPFKGLDEGDFEAVRGWRRGLPPSWRSSS